MEGYIRLSRRMLDWEWYSDINTKALFLHCLLMANWKNTKYKGVDVPRGSFVTTLPELADSLGLSMQSVRTSINHLKSTGELTVKRQARFSVFTVIKWDEYQSANSQANSLLTVKQQSKEEEGKKVNNNNIYNAQFDALWQAYPRKRDKAKAYKCYLARLNDGFSADELFQAVKRYADECRTEHREERYIKHAATFLGANTPFMDYLRSVETSGDDLLDEIERIARSGR